MKYLGNKLKGWVEGVYIDDNTLEQAYKLAAMPFIHKHVALMPDAHVGIGATVGSVIATKGAIIPAAVGVDLGCGMVAQQTSLKASDLPDNLHELRCDIEEAVPHGRSDNGGKNDKGGWLDNIPQEALEEWKILNPRYQAILEKHPKAASYNNINQLGTLGTGNHFVEICLDENQKVWIMLHSGSRGLGNKIGMYFIELAKKEMERWMINLPDKDLAYLPEGTTYFHDYMEAVELAQDFARVNREIMLYRVKQVLLKHFPSFTITQEAVNCHHNYVSRENHSGTNVLITRKGAVRARKGDLGIIPGSMGAKSFIVRGLGNEESFCSCSHGAGRVMSRTEAKKLITLDDHVKATAGVECRKDEGVIDESPAAYKDIDAVMEAQKDLVEIVHTLKQVLCVKG